MLSVFLRCNKISFDQNLYVMKKNMGIFDRLARVIIALVITILYFNEVITGTLGIVLFILGGVFLLTSVLSFCPLYLPFGISTNKTEDSQEA